MEIADFWDWWIFDDPELLTINTKEHEEREKDGETRRAFNQNEEGEE